MSELSSLHKDQTLGSLEKQLICPICLEIFTKPVVILPCQHNLCRKCANELYQVGVGGRFRCPSCRHEVVLDRHGVYGLQRNLLVENIIDVYKQECASSKAQSKPTIYPTCEEHEGEKVNIYCITCKVPTCSLCKVFGAHKTCQVAPIPEVYQQQKAELSDGIGSLVATNDRVQAVISELEEVRRNIEENGRTLKQTLCEKFDRMHAILEERRKIMTQQITYEQEGKSGHARSVLDTCREHVEANMKLVETSLHIMEKSDMAAFLKESRSLIQRVNDVSNSYTVETVEPGFERMDHYKVDFDEEERALHQLDFIKLEEEVEEGLDDAELEPDNENAFEYELEQELEPDADTISTLDLNPDRDQEMKTGPLGIKDPVLEEREDMHKEGLTGPTKPAKCESEGMSTQQGEPGSWHGEHDAGGQGNQGEDMKLYPSWYRASGWQMVSPGLAMVREHQAIPDCIPQMGQEAPSQSQVQTPQTLPMPLWVGTSFRPVAADHMTNQFGGGSLVGPQGSGSLATENTEQGDRPTSRGLVAPISPQMDSSLSSSPVEGPPLSHTTVSGRQCLLLSTSTSISPQAVTFCFYLVALLVILQRVWGHIQCIIST